jgi:nucleoside phosphorylase
MAVAYTQVDFLIVTALDVESVAVSELLEEKQVLTHDTVGKVLRPGYGTKYVVALTEIGGMGTNQAQGVTREAINRWNPRRVILTGIAAGFPEAGVNRGDVLVPYYIVPYELAKIKERISRKLSVSFRKIFAGLSLGRLSKQQAIDTEHRGFPTPTSFPLWHAANTLSRDETSRWDDAIREPRPDGTNQRPVVHSTGTSVLGSGDKLVATERAECRKWLLQEFPNNAIGLEMESFGALTACRMTDTPFLVVKAVQDHGTSKKDDRWRAYAAQASAAFTLSLIRKFELKSAELFSEHKKEVMQYAHSFERDAPQPPFTYTVSRASSYSLLKEGIYELPSQDPISLIPNDDSPAIALHGGGGTGKSRIVRSLIGSFVDKDLYPIFLDLRRYTASKHDPNGSDPITFIRDLLTCAVPRRTCEELEHLVQQVRLAVVIDGLNEVSSEKRVALVQYFQRMHKEGSCYMLVTDRFGPLEPLETFSHAAVDRLQPETVRTLFDVKFGAGSFEQLNGRLKKIFMRPFFLELCLKSKRKFTSQSIWSGIFEEFFRNQLRIAEEDLNRISENALNSFDNDGRFNLERFEQSLNGELFQSLLAAEVVAMDQSGFEHHLWRDYLVSRHLALKQNDVWNDNVFDVATTFASSLESLSLTVEQLRDQQVKDEFLKAVYDWSYIAAAGCIADFKQDEPEPRQLSQSIRIAILAAVVEKKFDAVERTRQRSEDILREHHYELAHPFIEAQSLEHIRQQVNKSSGSEGWFKQWKTLFVKETAERLSIETIELIASNDSLIGWTAANLARRNSLDKELQQRIRQIYKEAGEAGSKKSVRWRVVHVLGAYPDMSNVSFLLQALTQDPYHWVQYGAARALIEIAANSSEEIGGVVLSALGDFIETNDFGNIWIRQNILREIIEVAFIRKPNPNWKEKVRPFLSRIVLSEFDPTQQTMLKHRVDEFDSYDENQ